MAGPDPAPRPDDDFPVGIRQPFQQQEFHRCAAVTALAQKPRRNHARVVDHQAIPGCQQVRQIRENLVLDRTGAAIENQKARLVPPGQWVLGDQFFG